MAGRWRIVSLLLLLVPLAACGGGDATPAHAGSALQIESPEKGATVSVPFTVELSSDVPLGQPGRQHYVRVSYDGLEGPVVTDETFKVTKADLAAKGGSATGRHTIHVSLMTPDGEWTGSGDENRIRVTGG